MRTIISFTFLLLLFFQTPLLPTYQLTNDGYTGSVIYSNTLYLAHLQIHIFWLRPCFLCEEINLLYVFAVVLQYHGRRLWQPHLTPTLKVYL